MKNFNYNVNSYFADGSEMTFRTNNVRDAIEAFFENVENGVHCNIVNGFTGEVLAIACSPEGEDFATDEMALMMVGYLAEQAWGEDEEESDPLAELKEAVAGPLGAVAMMENAEPVVDPIIAMLDDLVAQGKAVKLPS